MKLHHWSVNTRNQLSMIYAEFDSAAAIEGAKMTEQEREFCKRQLKRVVEFIDKENNKARRAEVKKGSKR